jgi:hypothetical protein
MDGRVRNPLGIVLPLQQHLGIRLFVLASILFCTGLTAEAKSDYDIINTGIKGSGCWYDDTRFVLLKGHSESSSQVFVIEGMFYLDVNKPLELKPVDLTPLKSKVWQKIYRIRCLDQTILFSTENQSYSLHIGDPPELIAERLGKSIYPEYINYEARYVLSPRAKAGRDDSGVSPSQDAALKDCQFSYVKPGYTLHCWYMQLRGLPRLLPQFVFGESYWSDTIRIKGADGQEKRIPNPEPPIKLPDGSELKHGYVLYDLEKRVLQQIKLEQPPYQIYHRHLMKVDPQGKYQYATCSRAGDHGDKHYTEGGRVCRYKLDGNNRAWEEVFAVQQSPKDPFGLQDLDVNGQGDVVVIDRGHRLNQSMWKYTARSQKVEFVTRAPLDLEVPSVSPDGRWVSFILRGELHLACAKGDKP